MGKTLVESGTRRLAPLASVLAALFVLLAVAAQPAGAYNGYKHGTATSCTSCHSTGDTNVPPADADCTASGCHTGGFASRQTAGTVRTCWTCHDPGQDMSAVQGSGCASAAAGCHTNTPHYGSNALTCTSCHGTVVSASDPDGSAHHNGTVYTAPSTCTDCHTQAGGLHADYVAGAACTTCHAGFGTAHPAPAAMVAPAVVAAAKPAIVKYGLTTIVSGSVKNGLAVVPGVTVYLQQKPFGSADFSPVSQVMTASDGTYAFAATSPTLLTTYRVVTQGAVVSATVVKPAVKTVDVKVTPSLTVALSKTRILLGTKVTIKGTLAPARTSGTVKLQIQHKIGTAWKTVVAGKLVPLSSLTGYTTYSLPYKPPVKASSRGSWRVRASIVATTDLAATTTLWKTWTVK
jgi:hypothetical protein